MIQYVLRRLLVLPVIMFLVTAILFLLILQMPVEQRVKVYVPSFNPQISEEEFQELLQETIERRGLDQPFPVQCANWVRGLVVGD